MNCKGEGCVGLELLAFICRSVKGFVRLAGAALGDGGAREHMCSPIAEISISSPQLEHLIEGKKLAGRTPSAARAAASDIVLRWRQDYDMI